MQWRNRLSGLTLIAACVLGFYLMSQPAESGVPESEVANRLATERVVGKSDQKAEAVAITETVIDSTAKVETAVIDSTAKVETAVEPESKYSSSIVPENMTVQEKKQRFRALIAPAVDRVYQELDRQYQEVAAAIKTGTDSERIEKLKTEYRAETVEELLAALKPHPRSIVLAQAAMESAWGTSRFFVRANNVFGVWSFDENEARIAAGEKRGDKTIWLKKYDSIYASVKDNYRILARGSAFKEFRALRLKTDNPYELVKKLDRYSEKGDEYGRELASVISFNKFGKYDDTFYEREK